MPDKAKIFLVEDHAAVRRGLEFLVALEPGLAVCGEADSADAAFAQIIKLQPDAAILDLTLKQGSGIDLIPLLRVACPRLKIVVFSMHYESVRIQQALRAGADAYVPKEQGAAAVIATLRQLLSPSARPLLDGSAPAPPALRPPTERLS